MEHKKIQLSGKQADSYIIPAGAFNLVFVVTDRGIVGCGAFDVAAWDKYGFPAVRVRASGGSGIATIDDLLAGKVKDANDSAVKLGVTENMTGTEVLNLM